jgi:hypothetical protein
LAALSGLLSRLLLLLLARLLLAAALLATTLAALLVLLVALILIVRSGPVMSTAWRGREATLPASHFSNTALAGNGWTCLSRSRRG